MKQQGKRSQYILLGTVIILLSASFGILHSEKHTNNNNKYLWDMPADELRNHLEIFLLANDFNQIAQLLQRIPFQTATTLMQNLISQEDSPITNHEKVHVLFAAASAYNQPQQKQLFQLLTLLPQDTPVFWVGINTLYKSLVPSLANWARVAEPDWYNHWLSSSLFTSVSENDLEGLRAMFGAGIQPSQEIASQLLISAVEQSKKALFVPFLIHQMGANPNYISTNKTPLIAAVEKRNKYMVQSLLKNGADPKLIVDPNVGTAAQVAFDKNYTDIQMLIQSYEPL